MPDPPSSALRAGARSQERRVMTPFQAAAYAADIATFVATADQDVVGALAQPTGFTLTSEQRFAWREELPTLRAAIEGLTGWVFLEFEIPRLGRRIDAVVVTPHAVLVIEFKVGADCFDIAAREQVWDYALDLKNFHEPSHTAPIFPILCATHAAQGDERWRRPAPDGVRPPFNCSAASLGDAMRAALRTAGSPVLDPPMWGRGLYKPTPTIIEAARALYARHEVHELLRHDAGAQNLALTSHVIENATEFDVQGLELDWTCVTWDADLRWTPGGWSYHRFRGAKWQRVKKPDRQQYLVNAYRVLLTRARQGMVIMVPHGSRRDRTRQAAYYDGTYAYLRSLGIPEL